MGRHGTGGRCVEYLWPTRAGQLGDIAASLGYQCRSTQSGGSMYDPSASDGLCGWQGYVARSRSPNSRCGVTPPASTLRFCPCVDEEASADDSASASKMGSAAVADEQASADDSASALK